LWEEFSNQNPSREDLHSIIKDDESSSELKEKAGRMFIDKKNPDKEDLRLIIEKVKSLRLEAGQQMLENYQESLNENYLRLIIKKVKSLDEEAQEILDRIRKRKKIIATMKMIGRKKLFITY
jgi:SepF-like predicted cell division protein (DUF552 family)